MKTLKISDEVHQRLTSLLGELMAQTSRMQTYQDAIEAMLSQSVIVPPELLVQIQNFIDENKQLGFITREEFLRDAARWRLKFLREESEYLEIPKEEFMRLDKAVKEMSTPYHSALDFVHKQIEEVLEKYDTWLQEKEDHEKTAKNI